MDKNGKNIKDTRHISKRVDFVSNGESWKMHKIGWCEGGLKLAYIDNKNIGENYLTTIMKYIIVRLYNWYKTLVQ